MEYDLTAPLGQCTHHYLKCWPEFFGKIIEGRKSFEIRYNDRHFAVGHKVTLQEYDYKQNRYTGRELTQRILYLTDFLQKEGYVVMQLGKIYP